MDCGLRKERNESITCIVAAQNSLRQENKIKAHKFKTPGSEALWNKTPQQASCCGEQNKLALCIKTDLGTLLESFHAGTFFLGRTGHGLEEAVGNISQVVEPSLLELCWAPRHGRELELLWWDAAESSWETLGAGVEELVSSPPIYPNVSEQAGCFKMA